MGNGDDDTPDSPEVDHRWDTPAQGGNIAGWEPGTVKGGITERDAENVRLTESAEDLQTFHAPPSDGGAIVGDWEPGTAGGVTAEDAAAVAAEIERDVLAGSYETPAVGVAASGTPPPVPPDVGPTGTPEPHRFGGSLWKSVAPGLAATIVAIGVVIALLGGGDDDSNAGGGKKEAATPTTTAGAAAGGPLPKSLVYTATGPRTFNSTLAITSSCSGSSCAYVSVWTSPAAMLRGSPPPRVKWSYSGTTWVAELTADALSSSTGGAECVLHYSDSWALTVADGTPAGRLLVGTKVTGKLTRRIDFNPALSASGIAAKTCVPYSNTETFTINGTLG